MIIAAWNTRQFFSVSGEMCDGGSWIGVNSRSEEQRKALTCVKIIAPFTKTC